MLQAGLKAQSHGEAVIETSNGVVDIRFTLDRRVRAVLKSVLHNELDAWLLSHHALLREDDGQLVVDVRLPQVGRRRAVASLGLSASRGRSSEVPVPRLFFGGRVAGARVQKLNAVQWSN